MKNKPTITLIWLLSYISIASVSSAMITPALPEIARTFSLTTGAVEWVVSTFLIGYVVGQLVYGPLANVYGRLKALRWGLIINVLGLLLCLWASFYPHYNLLLVGRLITGLGSAAGLTCTFMLINEWLPETQRKIAMAYSILSFALGIGIAVLIGGLITQYTHWQGCFIVLLIQGVLALVGLKLFDETLTKPKLFHIPTLIKDYLHALSSFQLITFSAVWSVSSVVAYCYAAAAPQIANQYLNLSASSYGYWNILNIVGMLIGGLSARPLLKHYSVMQVILMGYLGCAIGIISLIIMAKTSTYNPFLFFMSTCMLYCFSSYLFAGGSYEASNAIEDRASASSMMSFINTGVATLSVVVMGYLSSSPLSAFLTMLISIVLITLLMLLIFKKYT